MLITLPGTNGNPRQIRLTGARSHLQIRTRPGSDCAVTIELTSKANSPNADIRITLAPHSRLMATFLWRGKGEAAITQRSIVPAGATLHLLNITEGSCTHDCVSQVMGRGGESSLGWVVHVTGKRRCILSSSTAFLARDGRGAVTLHGVAEDRSQIKTAGLITVPRSGAGTQVRLEQKILLLDSAAQAEAIPELKIETDDVQAGHAATVSRIPPEDLYYFASRGIAEKKARSMLIGGFLENLIDGIEHEGLRETVRKERRRHN